MFLVQFTNFDGSPGEWYLWDGVAMRHMGGMQKFVEGLRASGVPFAGQLPLNESAQLARIYGF